SRAAAGLIGGNVGGLADCWAVPDSGGNTMTPASRQHANLRISRASLLRFLRLFGFLRVFFLLFFGGEAANRPDHAVPDRHRFMAAEVLRSHAVDLVHDVHAVDDFAKNGVAVAFFGWIAIEKRVVAGVDEKLRAGRIGLGQAGHSDRAAAI